MATIYLESANLDYDHETEWLHHYELGDITIIPNAGDIIDITNDLYYDDQKRSTNGTQFIVTQRIIKLLREHGYRDDFDIILNVDRYHA